MLFWLFFLRISISSWLLSSNWGSVCSEYFADSKFKDLDGETRKSIGEFDLKIETTNVSSCLIPIKYLEFRHKTKKALHRKMKGF